MIDPPNTKPSAFLAFAGVLVKFAADLPTTDTIGDLTCYTCIIVRILTYTLLGLTAFFLCLVLTTKLGGVETGGRVKQHP